MIYLSLFHALLARAEEEVLTSGGDDGDLRELISGIQAIAVSLTTLAEHYHDWVLNLLPPLTLVPLREYTW